MREVERSAPSVEEALEAALEELGVSEQEAEWEVVQERRGGVLGIGSQEAVVRVRTRFQPEEEVDLEEQAEVAEEFVAGLLERMGFPADLDHALVDGVMYVDVLGGQDSEGMGLLIGRHGQTLDSLQELMRGAVQRRLEARCRVILDVEDYRKRRRSQLVDRAREAARRVKKTGKHERMEPMTSFERKVVHDAAGEVDGVETSSEGEEPERRVVIRRKR